MEHFKSMDQCNSDLVFFKYNTDVHSLFGKYLTCVILIVFAEMLLLSSLIIIDFK